MALIDTNILVYAADKDCRENEKARRWLEGVTEGADVWHITWQNVFEFIRVSTDDRLFHSKSLYIDEAIDRARHLLFSPSLQIIHPGPRHFEIFSDMAAHTPEIRGLFVHDARLAAIMIENGVREIYTTDEGFRRFREIRVINPFG